MNFDLMGAEWDEGNVTFGNVDTEERRLTLNWDEWVALERPVTIQIVAAE